MKDRKPYTKSKTYWTSRRVKLLQRLSGPEHLLPDPLIYRDKIRARDKKEPAVDVKRY